MARTKPHKRKPSRRSARSINEISHLHVVIDDALRDKLVAHAKTLDGDRDRPNLSAAVRDLLRTALGLPRTVAELSAAA